jgi:hypothetical protein
MPGAAAETSADRRADILIDGSGLTSIAAVSRPASRRVPSRRGCALLLAICAANLAAGAAEPELLPPLDAQGQLSPRWRVAGLPNQKPPLTRYSAVQVDGRAALRIDADASYGNFVLEAAGRPAPRELAWQWRVDQPNPAADLRVKAGDDTAARVCLSFDLLLDRVPFMERQLLRMARSASGEDLPAATLCWVWGRGEPVGQVIDNPYSRRVRYLVLRGQAEGTGRWLSERRDVAADFQRAFGDESAELPPLAAVVVAGDADNTGSRSRTYVRELSFGP